MIFKISGLKDIKMVALKKEPLFSLDLGKNGGVLVPTALQELVDWINRESQFWAWCSSVNTSGNHISAFTQAMGQINAALQSAQQAIQYEVNHPDHSRQCVQNAKGQIEDALKNRTLPHSTSLLGKRIEDIRQSDPVEAISYLFVFLKNPEGYQFEGRTNSAWAGYTAGIFERYSIGASSKKTVEAARLAFDELIGKSERNYATNNENYSIALSDWNESSKKLVEEHATRVAEFEEKIATNQSAFEEALAAHKEEMKTLQSAFREGMALRGPVDYWQTRSTHHEGRTTVLGQWAFGSIAALAVLIGGVAYWVLDKLNASGQPEAWRVATLVLIGVLGVWAVRLIVRMFLSHGHLATDAAERVVMAKTYLSLTEAGKTLSDEDRKLILQPLFRPASDGLVKDEGLPHPILEAITKIGK
jgi:Family of unknown function (DUF6161)